MRQAIRGWRDCASLPGQIGEVECAPGCTHMLAAMDIHRFITFASEAELVGLWGLGFIALAGAALIAEKRRNKYARLDRIGWVPWTAIFLVCAMIGGGLIALAAKGIAAG